MSHRALLPLLTLLHVCTIPPLIAALTPHTHYHSTAALLHAFQTLAQTCPHATLHYGHTACSHPPIPILTLSQREHAVYKRRKPTIMGVFGEHGRERITSELALHIARRICVEPGVLDRVRLVFVVVANPRSRMRVEGGEVCVRGNGMDVDVNRNYGYEWGRGGSSVRGGEEWAGEGAFSEGETRVVAAVGWGVKPGVYVSVHSGAVAVLQGWDSGGGVVEAGRRVGLEVGRVHCGGCGGGVVGEVFGYRAFGTGVDYMVGRVGVEVGLTVEVFGGREEDGCEREFNPREGGEMGGVLRRWEGMFETMVEAWGKGAVVEGLEWDLGRRGEEWGVWFTVERRVWWMSRLWLGKILLICAVVAVAVYLAVGFGFVGWVLGRRV